MWFRRKKKNEITKTKPTLPVNNEPRVLSKLEQMLADKVRIAICKRTRLNSHFWQRVCKLSDIDMKKFGTKTTPIALCSNNLINDNIAKKLINLIQPLQDKLYNERDPKFIKSKHDFLQIQELINKAKRSQIQELINTANDIDDFGDLALFGNDSGVDSEEEIKYIKTHKKELDILDIANKENKPKLKELIAKFQHFYFNKRICLSSYNNSMSLMPAIYDIEKKSFLTEINGLLYSSNIELYNVLGNIFHSMLPMFSWCLSSKLSPYKKLSVVIKMHEYIFNNKNDVMGIWHHEGNTNDNIVAVGLYYLNDDDNKNGLIWNENVLEIAEKECDEINQSIDIRSNDCIVFCNPSTVKHRARISTKYNKKSNGGDSKSVSSLSRKTLCFFLLDPENDKVAKYSKSPNDLKWINFPMKVDKILFYWFNIETKKSKKLNMIHSMNDIVGMIRNFCFGDDKYQQQEMSNIRMDRRGDNFYTFYRRPFHVERRPVFFDVCDD